MDQFSSAIIQEYVLYTLSVEKEAPRLPALVDKCMKSLEHLELGKERCGYIKRMLKHETLMLIDNGTLLVGDDYCIRKS